MRIRTGRLSNTPATATAPWDSRTAVSSRSARSASRLDSRAAIVWRLSYRRFPWPARFDLGETVREIERQWDQRRPGGRQFAFDLVDFAAVEQLPVRRAEWFVQVPWLYSGMCAARSHTSPSSTVANASAKLARPRAET